MHMDTKCKESKTPRDVYSSILQGHRRFISSEPFTSDSYERTFQQTSQTMSENTPGAGSQSK